MQTDEYRELLRKYVAGECTEEERLLLDNWYNNLDSGRDPGDSEAEKAELVRNNWQKLLQRQETLAAHTHETKIRRFLWGSHWAYKAAAAVFILLLLAGGSLLSLKIRSPDNVIVENFSDSLNLRTEIASAGSPRLLVLSDGSRVTLAPGSLLRYKTSFGEERREVYLQGEGYFEVAENPQKPFYVYANDIVTRVLGTSFLVDARDRNQEVKVSVTKGKVAVYPVRQHTSEILTGKEVILTPRQQVSYSGQRQEMTRSEVEDIALIVPKEKPDRVIFENAPVPALLEAIMRAHPVRFEFEADAFSECAITTSMEDETLEEMLSIISKLLDIKYTVSGATIRLEGKGC